MWKLIRARYSNLTQASLGVHSKRALCASPALVFNTHNVKRSLSSENHAILSGDYLQIRSIHSPTTFLLKDVKTMKLPSLGDSISEGCLSEWKKSVGDYVAVDEPLATVETDKVTVDINASIAGVITKRYSQEGDAVFVGKPFVDVDTSVGQGGTLSESLKPEDSVKKGGVADEKVETTLKKQSEDAVPSESVRSETRVKLSMMRLRIGERLKKAQNDAVMLTTFNECDMGDLMELRRSINESGSASCKLGYVSAFMRAASLSLLKFPIMNSYIEGKDIVTKNYVDISVAVSVPAGLVVPVIRDCNNKSWEELEMQLVKVASMAREGQLSAKDMEGGTFTISNGGIYGSVLSTPIINPPQSSILGMHSIIKRCVVRNDAVVIRPIMNLALSYDHRLVDGREAVQFLASIKEYIENPSLILEK